MTIGRVRRQFSAATFYDILLPPLQIATKGWDDDQLFLNIRQPSSEYAIQNQTYASPTLNNNNKRLIIITVKTKKVKLVVLPRLVSVHWHRLSREHSLDFDKNAKLILLLLLLLLLKRMCDPISRIVSYRASAVQWKWTRTLPLCSHCTVQPVYASNYWAYYGTTVQAGGNISRETQTERKWENKSKRPLALKKGREKWKVKMMKTWGNPCSKIVTFTA